MKKLIARKIEDESFYGQMETFILIYPDGTEHLATFGGEPEDNSRRRDYNWVFPAFTHLCTLLGVEFVVEEEE